MDINITGRNITLSDELKGYVHKRLSKLDKLYERIFRAEVVLEEEKIRKNVEVILHLKRNRIIAKETSPDIYASIDEAADTLSKQLRRMNERIRTTRRRSMFRNFRNAFGGGRFMKFMPFYNPENEEDNYSEKQS
ncbi:MAG: ribosome-associated translation inhibitor RaiA [Candidatus Omnitrophica bacterium]|nr:ribosome-associated translation inhibitor RaiA [Candidatus Omnitrophota bacterium]